MTFKEWLKKRNLTLNKASKFLNVSFGTIRNVFMGSENLSRKTGELIEEKTLGEVGRIEVLWPEWSKSIRIVRKKEGKDESADEV